MATSLIRQQLDDLIAHSRVFAMLNKLDQLEFLKQLEVATDEQILATVQAIEEEESNLVNLEKQKLEIAKKQIELSENLRNDLKDSEKILLRVNEDEEDAKSASLLNQMEAEIDHLAPSKPKPENKKFLGLF